MGMKFDLRDFRGLDYVNEGRLIQNSHALAVTDAKLWDGTLRTFPCPEPRCEYGGVAEKIIDCDICPCTTWDTLIHMVDDCNAVVGYTGDGTPKVAPLDDFCAQDPCSMAFACPETPPIAVLSPAEGGYKAQDYREYPDISTYCQEAAEPGDDGAYDYDHEAPDDPEFDGEVNCVDSYQGELHDTRYFSHFYTNVYSIGGKTYESAPSPSSVSASGKLPVTLTGLVEPADGCFVTHRIYRIESGTKLGEETETPVNNTMVYVGETAADTYIDNTETWATAPPPPLLLEYGGAPDDLTFLHKTESGVFFGLVNDELWFTLPGKLNTWSMRRRRLIERSWGRPLAMVTHNDDIYVLTDKKVVWYQMALTDSGPTLNRYTHRAYTPLVSVKSITVSEVGVVFASDRGLVAVFRNQIQVISSPYFDNDRWRQLDPDSMVATIYGDTYVMSTSVDAFMFEFSDSIFSERPRTDIVGLDMGGIMIGAEAMAPCDRGILVAKAGTIYYWDWYQHPIRNHFIRHCDEELERPCCPYKYRSKIEDENRSFTYTAAEIHFGNEISNPEVIFRLWEGNCDNDHDCGCVLVEECVITSCEPFRLPGCRRGEDHWIELEGCAHITSVTLATSFHQLRGDSRAQ